MVFKKRCVNKVIPGYDEWLEPPEDDDRPTKEELIELGVIGDDEE
ncbi:hypothetical protein SNK12g_13400 [Lactiplantibacillus plantarum]